MTRTHLKKFTHGLVLFAALATATLSSSISAHAAKARIPARFYPSGAHLGFTANLSNHQMDCQWGFFCEGPVPLFHFRRQDDLHRLGGWAQYAGWHRHHRSMLFALYASRYADGVDIDGVPWSRAALNDLVQATRSHHYIPLQHPPRLLPAGMKGVSFAALQRSGTDDLVVMACAGGQYEVEALVVFDHRSPSARTLALYDLAQQVRAAAGSSLSSAS